MNNSIMVLQPYWDNGCWVFDDPNFELVKEAFVLGVSEIITDATKNIKNAKNGFKLIFSSSPFPKYTHELSWRREELGGNWYYCPQTDSEGWLCPQLFCYFEKAPANLYCLAEQLDK